MLRGTVDALYANQPLCRPASAHVRGHGWVSELPGRDNAGRKLTGREAKSDWGSTNDHTKALVLSPSQQVRLYKYYFKNLGQSVGFTDLRA